MVSSNAYYVDTILCVGSILLLQCYITHELNDNLFSSNVVSLQKGNNCTPGYFGQGCARQCPVTCSQKCDNQGLCTVCSRLGMQLPDCSRRCTMGLYGLHCRNKCMACRYGNCEPKFGECQKCKFPGFRLPFCKAPCFKGSFGMHCRSRCPLPCAKMCDPVTGDCTKCQHGHGPRCQVNCAREDSREVCRLYCPNKCLTWCNTADGTCSVCAPGYKPPYCKHQCDDGYYGNNCEETCPVRCTKRQCHPISGICNTCHDGYVGHRCNGQCVPGLYGPDCLLPCSESCAGGLCNFSTGSCTSCSLGYSGEQCDELCQEGKYGGDCKLECPVTCGGKCDPVTGECWNCIPGYVGVLCNETCKRGTHGQGCVLSCPIGCLHNICHHETGTCSSCNNNLSGNFCEDLNTRHPIQVKLVTFFSLALTVVAILLAIVAVCLKQKIHKRCVTRNTENHNDMPSKSETLIIKKTATLYDNHECESDIQTTPTHQKLKAHSRAAMKLHSVKLSERYVKMHSTNYKQFRYENASLLPCAGRECSSCDELKESTERISHAVNKTFLSHLAQGTGVPSCNIYYSRKLNGKEKERKSLGSKGISKLVSKLYESKLSLNSLDCVDKFSLTNENKASGITTEGGELETEYVGGGLRAESNVLTIEDRASGMKDESCILATDGRTCSLRTEGSILKTENKADGMKYESYILATDDMTCYLRAESSLSTIEDRAGGKKVEGSILTTDNRAGGTKAECSLLITEDMAGGMKAGGSILTKSAKGYRSRSKNLEETDMALSEHTAGSQGKAAGSCSRPVISSVSALRTSERSPEMINSHSRDSIKNDSNRSTDFIFTVKSEEFSHGSMTYMDHLTEMKRAPASRNSLLVSTSHCFIDTQNGDTNKIWINEAPLRTQSTHDVSTAKYSTPIACATSKQKVDHNQVISFPMIALVSVEQHKSTRSVGNVEQHNNSHDVKGQPEGLFGKVRCSCDSERLVPVSGVSKISLSAVDIGCLNTIGPLNLDKQEEYSDFPEQTYGIISQSSINSPSSVPYFPHTSNKKISKNQESYHLQTAFMSPKVDSDLSGQIPKRYSKDLSGQLPKSYSKAESAQNEDIRKHIGKQQTTRMAGAVMDTCAIIDIGAVMDTGANKTISVHDNLVTHLVSGSVGTTVSKRSSRVNGVGETPSPKLIRCSTTRQVSPMYANSNLPQVTTRLQPLPTPPPEGIKSLRPIRKTSMSPTSILEFLIADPAEEK